MQRFSVELPEGDLVDTFLFTRNIARALMKLTEDPHTVLTEGIFEFKNAPIKVALTDMTTIAALTTENRRLLREILDDLPKLTFASDDIARKQFLECWEQHPKAPKAPAWRPKLPNMHDYAGAEFKALSVQNRHLDQLQEWVDGGTLRAFDRHHLSAWKVGLNVYISREDAENYLEKHCMDVTISEPAIHSGLLCNTDATNRTASVMTGNLSETAGVREARHHSSEWAMNTVDGLLNFLINSKLGESGALEQPLSEIVKQVVLAFLLAVQSKRPQDLQTIENNASHFQILRLRGGKITRETIRGRIRTRRKKLLAANGDGQ